MTTLRHTISHDGLGTHIDWQHDEVSARKKETVEEGKVWAAHCAEEIGNWGHFLPQLYTLYKVVTDTSRNPFADLSVAGTGSAARYRFMEPGFS
jgi:hypothetical protein